MVSTIVRLVVTSVLVLIVGGILLRSCSPGSGALRGGGNAVPGSSRTLAGNAFPVNFYGDLDEAVVEAKCAGKRLFIVNAAMKSRLFQEAFSLFSDLQTPEAVAVQSLVNDYYVVCIPKHLPRSMPSLGWSQYQNKVLLVELSSSRPQSQIAPTYAEDSVYPATRRLIKHLATMVGVNAPSTTTI